MHAWKRLAIGALAVSSTLFVFLAANIVAGDPLALPDARIASWLHAHSHPALTLLMLAVTHAHGALALCTYAAVMAALLWRRRESHWLLAIGLAVPVGLLINVLLKYLFQRARPVFEDPLLTLSTYSFPSGHTAGATLFYGIVTAYVFSRTRSTRLRVACVACWALLVALVGFSRMYLGVHYFTDVVAAATWSLAWVGVCVMLARRMQMHSAGTRSA